MSQEYLCSKTGISSKHMGLYESLIYDDRAGTERIKQERRLEVIRELRRYGQTRSEIIDYFNNHIKQCRSCENELDNVSMCLRH